MRAMPPERPRLSADRLSTLHPPRALLIGLAADVEPTWPPSNE